MIILISDYLTIDSHTAELMIVDPRVLVPEMIVVTVLLDICWVYGLTRFIFEASQSDRLSQSASVAVKLVSDLPPPSFTACFFAGLFFCGVKIYLLPCFSTSDGKFTSWNTSRAHRH